MKYDIAEAYENHMNHLMDTHNGIPELEQQQRQAIADAIGKDALLAIEHAVQVEHILRGQCAELAGADEVNRVTQIYCATIIASALVK